jgi:hypothetical protein
MYKVSNGKLAHCLEHKRKDKPLKKEDKNLSLFD